MIEWLYAPSQIPNGTVLAILVACASMVALVLVLSKAHAMAETGAKFLLDEVFKGVARESILLKSLSEREPEDFERTMSEFREGNLCPSWTLVHAIRKAGGHHA